MILQHRLMLLVVTEVLQHRIVLSYQAQADNISAQSIIQKILKVIKAP
jgi:MoxR-like ATPase